MKGVPGRRKITLLALLLAAVFAAASPEIAATASATTTSAISKTASGDFFGSANSRRRFSLCNSKQALGKSLHETPTRVCALSYGKEADQISKLNYYGYRYYDPLSLTWTQSDPLFRVAPDLAFDQPRLMSLYAFSLNNPVRYLDPDGRDPAALNNILNIKATVSPNTSIAVDVARGAQILQSAIQPIQDATDPLIHAANAGESAGKAYEAFQNGDAAGMVVNGQDAVASLSIAAGMLAAAAFVGGKSGQPGAKGTRLPYEKPRARLATKKETAKFKSSQPSTQQTGRKTKRARKNGEKAERKGANPGHQRTRHHRGAKKKNTAKDKKRRNGSFKPGSSKRKLRTDDEQQ